MVLTASSYPDEDVQQIAANTSKQDTRSSEIFVWTTRLGLLRVTPEKYLPEMLRVYFGYLRQYLPPRTAECEIAFLHQTKHVQSFMIERARPTPKEEIEDVAACTRGFGNMPLVVLSEKWVYSPNADGQEKEEARREAERQARLAALSTRGKKIDLDSGHLIPLESPSAVVDAIRHVVLTAQSVQ
jgi:hypothetical protein